MFIDELFIDYFNINNGGCGIVALLIGCKLKSDKFLWCCNGYREFKPQAPGHYYVVHDGKAYDIRGQWTITELTNEEWTTVKEVTVEFVLESVRQRHTWNNDYNRNNTIHIASLLDVDIPEYLKQVI